MIQREQLKTLQERMDEPRQFIQVLAGPRHVYPLALGGRSITIISYSTTRPTLYTARRALHPTQRLCRATPARRALH